MNNAKTNLGRKKKPKPFQISVLYTFNHILIHFTLNHHVVNTKGSPR